MYVHQRLMENIELLPFPTSFNDKSYLLNHKTGSDISAIKFQTQILF